MAVLNAPSTISLEERPSKRVKTSPVDDVTARDERETGVKPHPLRIRPSGNAYTSSSNLKAASGFFKTLEDELLLQLLESLSPQDLVNLGSSCKFFYAFTRHDELWRDLFIRYVSGLTHAPWSLYLVVRYSQSNRCLSLV